MRNSSILSIASGLSAAVLLAPAAIASDAANGWREVAYNCESGDPLTVQYRETGSSVKVQLDDRKPVRLNARPAKEGFRYADSLYELRGEGEVVTFQIGSSTAVKCVSGDPSAADITASITR